jgi:hypothetical protein
VLEIEGAWSISVTLSLAHHGRPAARTCSDSSRVRMASRVPCTNTGPRPAWRGTARSSSSRYSRAGLSRGSRSSSSSWPPPNIHVIRGHVGGHECCVLNGEATFHIELAAPVSRPRFKRGKPHGRPPTARLSASEIQAFIEMASAKRNRAAPEHKPNLRPEVSRSRSHHRLGSTSPVAFERRQHASEAIPRGCRHQRTASAAEFNAAMRANRATRVALGRRSQCACARRSPAASELRSCTMSRSGGAPYIRRYSRLNCDGLS